MAEQYDIAAWRHLNTGEILFRESEFDDAGYHYGVVGENALKQFLRHVGVEAYWIANPPNGRPNRRRTGDPLRNTPMRGHFPALKQLVAQAQASVALFAVGRLAGPIQTQVLSSSFQARFANWHIDIRYAATSCTPVSEPTCTAWRTDAEELVLTLLI